METTPPTDINLLMQKTINNDQLYAKAQLEGLRFVTASETKEGDYLNEGLIKELTGRPTLQGRHPYGGLFKYFPQFKLIIDANHEPGIRGIDPAIWGRVKLIPFDVTFTDEQKDRQLLEKLKGEASGILAWMLRGCLEWQSKGLPPSTKITEAVQTYKERMDVMEDFINERCERVASEAFQPSTVHKDYVLWCRPRGEKPIGRNGFGARLVGLKLKPIPLADYGQN